MNDLVSIITPSYNTSKFIAETIKCVQAQTYENWEMIIVDDCSTDNTEKVVKEFQKDTRIKFYRNEKNSGAAVSRNRALKMAKGRWIAFLDSDDLWSSDKLKKQIFFMEKNGYHFSYTNYSEIDDFGKPLGTIWTGPKKIGKLRMTMFNYMGCLTVMYDRDYVGLIQVEDIKKRNDYAMWVKVIKRSPAYLLDECLALYRIRSHGSLMNREKHSIGRMKYNYELWNVCERKGRLYSLFLTGVNALFGITKKIIYKHNCE